MKKAILRTLAVVLAISTVLSAAGLAMAQNESVPAAEAVAIRAGLAIKAPTIARAGEPLEIQIVTRPGERPVSQAEVWAVDIDKNEATLTADAASLIQCHGVLLGTTNDRGYVEPAPRIQERGKYILVAIKQGFDPGFAMIKITSEAALTLRAPDAGRVNQPVKMQVTDPAGQGVGRVAIFAIPLLSTSNDTSITRDYDLWLKYAEAYADTLESPTTTSQVDGGTEAWEQIRRYFIGLTDCSGYFEYRFTDAGPYLLIAAKCGYTPDFQIIKITSLQTVTPEKIIPAAVEQVAINEATISIKAK